ncbi:reverse transcriptase (RNA-dependent DNA polymerase) domain-containing protein [Phthorimaea operculella]|nr:reverse transcriptase (RNA-dependent DNA polymerase) domain-containing protein [Phthorimaea operculella]
MDRSNLQAGHAPCPAPPSPVSTGCHPGGALVSAVCGWTSGYKKTYLKFLTLLSNDSMKDTFKLGLKKLFVVKDLGPVKDCLGMRVVQKPGNISLDQTKYIEKVIEKFGFALADLGLTTCLSLG